MRKIIKIGDYEIHSCEALIKITYDDGSVKYDCESGFTNEEDLMCSAIAIDRLMKKGTVLPVNGKKIVDWKIIRGLDQIRSALEEK